MNFPQVAILWWDESKADNPSYFQRKHFPLINGELVLVKEKLSLPKDYLIQLPSTNTDTVFVAH